MKNFISILVALALVSTLSAACANLSDDSTWGAMIVNNSGVLEVHDNTVLCEDTFHLSSTGFAAPALLLSTPDISLDCNDSVFDGTDGAGNGIVIKSVENVVVGNCSVTNYSIAFSVVWVNNSFIANNTAFSNMGSGFELKSFSNNTLVNNTAYSNAWYGFIFDIATIGDIDRDNVLIDDRAYNNSDIAFWLRDTAMYNNLTNCFAYNQTTFFYQEDIGAASNNLTNFTVGYNETVGLISFGFISESSLALVQNPAAYLYLQPDFVSLYSDFLPQADVASTITIEGNCSMGVIGAPGFYTTKADILDSGFHYPTTVSCSDGIATFDVSGFSGYTLGEEQTYLTLSILPDTEVSSGTETTATCSASNSEVNLTLYRDGAHVVNGTTEISEVSTLPIGSYFYECNATGSGNYSNATASDTLDVVTCTNISSPMAYTMTYNMEGFRTYGFTPACVYITSSDVLFDCNGYSITGTGGYSGIWVSGFLTNVSIYNCSVSNYTDGIGSSSSYGEIANNDLFNNTNSGATLNGEGNNVSNNQFHNNTIYGFFSSGAGNRIYNNTMYDNSVGTGMHLAADNHVAFNNTIFNNSYGMYIASDYNVIFNNTIFDGGYGAYLDSANYNNLSENEITNNSAYGIYILESWGAAAGYNNILDNIIANNGLFQMFLSDSYDNLIYNNIFNASGVQEVISSDTYEFWNISKTLGANIIGGLYKGGNFYSNYTGVDTDGDGIGNTPYVLNSYSSTTTQDVYSSEQASAGAWTDFASTYDQDWSTYGNAPETAEGYYNFTIPAGADTTLALVTVESCGSGGGGGCSNTMMFIGSLTGFDCLSSDPLQIKMVSTLFKGTVRAYIYCYDYGIAGWSPAEVSMADPGSATDVDFYELNTTFYILGTSNSIDYLPLTNNLNYAPNVTIVSIGGQGNNSEISSLTPDIIFNATDLDNSTLNCTVYVDATIAGGTNATVENGTLTTITLNYSLTAGQAYDFTVNCSDNTTVSASSAWTETVASASTGRSHGNPSGDEPLSIIADDEVPTGSSMAIAVERDGEVTLPNAHVVITFGTDTVFTGYTDSWGRVFFTPENAGTYRISATKLGYVAANDSFTAVATECASNDNCAYNEKCEQGACEKVPEGECGRYSNHAWEDYECCSSSDCGENERCTNNECVQRPEEPETGCTIDTQCQQGHRCESGACVQVIVPPECTVDSDCQQGFICVSNACVQAPPETTTQPEEGGEPTEGTSAQQGGLFGSILSLWWLWLILIALVAWYFYRTSREKKA
ncbi:MAG: NosD domain-containing protein [Candidatus ainarchaeum sp.]|nr:NosD domain-containing protein [Candidatus ainarchaeum sp.]